jgi:signal transduction histidine kinase
MATWWRRVLAPVRRVPAARTRSLAADLLLAAALTGLSILSARGDSTRGAHVPALTYPLMLGFLPAIALRRRWPGSSLTLMALAQAGLVVLHTQPSANVLAWLVAPYSAAGYASRRVQLAIAGATAAMLLVLGLPLGPGWAQRAEAIQLIVIGAGAWIAGMVVRSRRAAALEVRQRAQRLEAEREEHARQVAAQERLRIARELHDIVAHKLSIVVVQAQAAQRVADPIRATGLMATVEETGRSALEEMRRLLGVLRPSPEEPAASSAQPQPGLAALDMLLDQVRAAGLPVTLTRSGEPVPLPDALDLSAYRIVQEALTNALKHAGPAHAAVRLRYGTDQLEITVADDGQGALSAVPSSGHGLTGMRERAALLGGALEAGPQPRGGFRVHVRLPISSMEAR